MTDAPLGPGERTRVRRRAQKAHYDADTINAILDEARLCHVATLVEGKPVALPTLHARDGRTLYLHGSLSNEILKALLREGEAFVTVTLYDGLRLARSAFESSIAYRSVVLVGPTREIVDVAEKDHVLGLFVERVLEGRSSEVRATTEQELRLTRVVAVEIDEASAKVSFGPTADDEADMALPIWSGLIPSSIVFGDPVPDVTGAMAGGQIPVPASVRRLLDTQ